MCRGCLPLRRADGVGARPGTGGTRRVTWEVLPALCLGGHATECAVIPLRTLVAQGLPLVPCSSLNRNSWLTRVSRRRLDSQATVPTLGPVAHPSPWPEARTGVSRQPGPRGLGYRHLRVTNGAEDGPPGAWPEAASAPSVSSLEPGVGQGPGGVHMGGEGVGDGGLQGAGQWPRSHGGPCQASRGPSSCSLVPGLLRPPGSKLPTLWVRGFHDHSGGPSARSELPLENKPPVPTFWAWSTVLYSWGIATAPGSRKCSCTGIIARGFGGG